jgi:hypothetical protein
MSVSISNLLVDPRPGRRVRVSGQVTTTGGGNNYAVVQITGQRVNALCVADPTTGKFECEVPVDIDLTTTVYAQAFNAYGTSSKVSGTPNPPSFSGSLGITTAQVAGAWTITATYSATWGVDLADGHWVQFASVLPQVNGVWAKATDNDGSESLTWSFTLPVGQANPTGTQVGLVVYDSWGLPHMLVGVCP